ncbi:hypothetical protein AMAG_09134 [Allomyces macrogynus ATCC 38327]|uniref:Centrosomal protein of 19 kDa n=1 Tax=Allomyces macrogynus (strain ATCC 38327) TaxID=578462 RepID=A0A0L0SNI1_ALLM3|nr:hypothetical protein AMAG_09134 [Allomyces macrogynus ATCC 38327]|eukprot:KNE64076.1 hypothetical protein AMAG_09134 [Allomyces macrogynus ATCC 38327]
MPDTTSPWAVRSATASPPPPHPHQLVVARTVYFHPTEPVLFVDYDVLAAPPSPGTGKSSPAAHAPHHRRRRRRIPIRAWRRAKAARSIAEAAAQLMDRHGDVFRSIGEPAVRDLLARLDRINKTAAIARALGVATATAQAMPLSASSSMSLRGGALELRGGQGETVGRRGESGKMSPTLPTKHVASPPVVTPLTPLPARVAPLSTVPAALSAVPVAVVQDGVTTPAVKTMRQIQLIGSDVDLNKLDEEQVALIKAQMNAEFEQIRIKPGDAEFEYDKRVEFSKDADASNDWDDSIDQLRASKPSSPVHSTSNGPDESVVDEDIVEECLPETSELDKSLSSASKSSSSRRAWGHLAADAAVSAPVAPVPAEPRVLQDNPAAVEKNDVAVLVSSAMSPFAPAPQAAQLTEPAESWTKPRTEPAAAAPIQSPSLSSIDIDDLLDDGDNGDLSLVGCPSSAVNAYALDMPAPAPEPAPVAPATLSPDPSPSTAPAPVAQPAPTVPASVSALVPAPALGLSVLGLPPLAPVASRAGGSLRPVKLPGLDQLAAPVRVDTIGEDHDHLDADKATPLAATAMTSQTQLAAPVTPPTAANEAPITASATTAAASQATLEPAASVVSTTAPRTAAIADESGLDNSIVSEIIDEDLSAPGSPDASMAKLSHRSASPDSPMAKSNKSALSPDASIAKLAASPDVSMDKSDLSAISPDASSMAKSDMSAISPDVSMIKPSQPQAAHSPPRSTSPAPSDMYSDDFGAGETASEADTTRTSSHATDDASDASFSAGHTASTRSDVAESDDDEGEGEKRDVLPTAPVTAAARSLPPLSAAPAPAASPVIASTLTALTPATTSLTQVPAVPLTPRVLAGVSLSDDEDEDIPLEIEGYESDAASDF